MRTFGLNEQVNESRDFTSFSCLATRNSLRFATMFVCKVIQNCWKTPLSVGIECIEKKLQDFTVY